MALRAMCKFYGLLTLFYHSSSFVQLLYGAEFGVIALFQHFIA